MTPTLESEEWLRFMRNEYLDTFVKEGGATIKYPIALREEIIPSLRDGLIRNAEESGYLVAHVDAANTKVQMMDQIFFRIAEQIPWRIICEKVILKLAAQHGYIMPLDGEKPLIIRIAEANHVTVETVQLSIRPLIEKNILKYYKYAKEFRIALTHLCSMILAKESDMDYMEAILMAWLTGKLRSVSDLKSYGIYNRINRTNARFMFESLLRWIRFGDYSGLMVVMDIRRLSVSRNPRNDKLYYTKAQLLDAYETLRQFMDSLERLKGFFMVVIPDIDFINEDSCSRGIGLYQALRFRVVNEIHDRERVNPMATMIEIG